MATADLLLELMFSWIDKRELCARQLKKLANELVSLRKTCNARECRGSLASVVGAACVIGAGAATLLTSGAAVPFLFLLGQVCTGVGVTVSVVTKLTEHFLSSNTMKEAEEIVAESNDIAQTIQKLFDQQKAEIKKVSSSADPDEVDRVVMTELLGAMARRSALEMKVDFSKLHDMLQRSSQEAMNMQLNQSSLNTMLIPLANILTIFAIPTSVKGFNFLIAEGSGLLIKEMSKTAVKTAFKGGAMVAGGAVGLVFSLPEAVDNWKEMIENNHVTEASQSLTHTADTFLTMTRELREQFDNLRKMLVDMAEQQEGEDEESDQEDEESDQEDEESDQEDEESDQEDEESDQEDEESDKEDEESDQEDEESDQEDEESNQEDEEDQQVDDLPNITTFECVTTVLQHDTWNEPILFINVYRPPTYNTRAALSAFLKEFQSLLDHYRNYNNITVAGDFNIWVDIAKLIPSLFLEFLENNNLVQHVTEPTHKKNHILDLVMSRNVDISDLCVQDDRISDHYTISFKAKPEDQEGKAVKAGLLNCRSVNNKPEKIFGLIERNNLDIFLLTETWSKDDTAFKVFRKASPEGFTFRYESRKERRGGGVAILIRKELLKQIKNRKKKKRRKKEE